MLQIGLGPGIRDNKGTLKFWQRFGFTIDGNAVVDSFVETADVISAAIALTPS